uniref:Uncharacterized protein n=1 Tax=Romanomermis culicivorax TaxID=13658 RepID=A0A915IK39_ROMCU
MNDPSAPDDIEQQITDDTTSQRSSSSLGVAFDSEFVAKVARCKMQYPDMFVSDFFNDDSGIYPQPDLEQSLKIVPEPFCNK